MDDKQLIYKIIERTINNISTGVGHIYFDYTFMKYGRAIWTREPIVEGTLTKFGLEIKFLKNREIEINIFNAEESTDVRYPHRHNDEKITYKFGLIEWHFKTKKLLKKMSDKSREFNKTNVYKQLNKVLPGFVDEEFILRADTDS